MSQLDQVLTHIQSRGERITVQRRLVLEALFQMADHLTIVDIQRYIQERSGETFSEVTIYRILQWLKDLQIVTQTDMGKTGIVYALIGAPCHHHLICLNCGVTFMLDDAYIAPLRSQLVQDYGFEVRIDHMAIYGYCQSCSRLHRAGNDTPDETALEDDIQSDHRQRHDQ